MDARNPMTRNPIAVPNYVRLIITSNDIIYFVAFRAEKELFIPQTIMSAS